MMEGGPMPLEEPSKQRREKRKDKPGRKLYATLCLTISCCSTVFSQGEGVLLAFGPGPFLEAQVLSCILSLDPCPARGKGLP